MTANITELAGLLGCPFCGREPEQSSRPSTKSADEIDGHIFFISCKCGGFSARAHQYGHSQRQAADKWNTRTPDIAAMKERIEALETEHYQSICEWRTAFDEMHQRAMKAERTLLNATGGTEHG